jgi:hypothetical protein
VPDSQQAVATPKVLPMPISSWLDRDESAPRLIPCFELEGVIFIECCVRGSIAVVATFEQLDKI